MEVDLLGGVDVVFEFVKVLDDIGIEGFFFIGLKMSVVLLI